MSPATPNLMYDVPVERTSRKQQVREQMILENLPQIKYIAQRIAAKLPPNIEMDDLISAGILGLLDAVEKFDPLRGVKFKTYADRRIKGAILDSLRNLDWAPRSLRKKGKDLERPTGIWSRASAVPPTTMRSPNTWASARRTCKSCCTNCAGSTWEAFRT